MSRAKTDEFAYTKQFEDEDIAPKKPHNKRVHERFNVNGYSLTCKKHFPIAFLSKNIGKELKDLSAGGIRFATDTCLPLASKVYIRIELEKFKDSFSCFGEVRWIKGFFGKGYEIGIKFKDITESDAQKIEAMKGYFNLLLAKTAKKSS